IAERVIGPDALRTIGETEPDWTDVFQLLRQRAIIDQRVSYARDATGVCKCIRAHEHATSRRGRCIRTRLRNPGERKQHLKEIDKGRDVRTFGKAFTA